MRWIHKKGEPPLLARWRRANKDDINFGYDLMRKDRAVTQAVLKSLIEEQGSLCAYTGLTISEESCHIEHIVAQAHCERGKDVTYRNLVACFPKPGQSCTYGAVAKRDWPKPGERAKFISPLQKDCETRLDFRYSGKVRPLIDTDGPARETINRLNLDAPFLIRRRGDTIRGFLGEGDNIIAPDKADRLLKQLERQTSGARQEFEFAVRQELRRYIAKIKKIAAQKRQRP